MADTIRDRAALLALLSDNVTGDISANDARDVLVSVHGVYGMIYVAGGSAGQTGVGGTPTPLTGFTNNGLGAGTTPDHTTDKITVGTAGVYLLVLQTSFGGSVGVEFECHIYRNVADTGFGFHRKLGATGDVGSASVVGLATLAANDTVSVYVASDGVNKTLTLVDGQLIVYRIA
jgi:hypothetical protein